MLYFSALKIENYSKNVSFELSKIQDYIADF